MNTKQTGNLSATGAFVAKPNFSKYEKFFIFPIFAIAMAFIAILVFAIKTQEPTDKFIGELVKEAHGRDTYGHYGSIKALDGMRFVAIEDKQALDGVIVLADGLKPELCAKFAPNYLRCVDDVTAVKPGEKP